MEKQCGALKSEGPEPEISESEGQEPEISESQGPEPKISEVLGFQEVVFTRRSVISFVLIGACLYYSRNRSIIKDAGVIVSADRRENRFRRKFRNRIIAVFWHMLCKSTLFCGIVVRQDRDMAEVENAVGLE